MIEYPQNYKMTSPCPWKNLKTKATFLKVYGLEHLEMSPKPKVVEVKSENPNNMAFFDPSLFLIAALNGALRIYAIKKIAMIKDASLALSSLRSSDEVSIP